MKGKGCTDATFAVKSTLQTLHEHGHNAYVLFIDLVKAFDSANRELLWKILKIYGIPDKTIEVLKKLHVNVTYQLKVGKKMEEIESTVGVKQGDNLGPILFIYLMNAVSEALNKKWNFKTPDLRWHGMKEDGTHKYNPKLKYGTSHNTQGTAFTITSSYYVDDTAYIFLNREDLEEASKLIMSHFSRFGLTVHSGNKQAKENSKTEAMFIPASGYTPTASDTADIMLNDNEFFGFCTKFKYLGTYFANSLDDSTDIRNRISKASGAFATMKRVLQSMEIPEPTRVRAYEATVLNILLYGCESWALKEADRKKLEACHHRFLRGILKISMFDVKEQHIKNTEIRERLNCNSLEQHMELRRARWLEKLALMSTTRNPRKAFVSWTPHPRPTGRPHQSIRHGYASTIKKSLGIPDRNSSFNSWMNMARDHGQWGKHVESALKLKPGSYKPMKLRRQ